MSKITGLVNRGINTFGILMKCKLVSIIIFLFTGTLHIIDPRGGLRGTVGMLSAFIALYALLSFIFILTGNNEKVGEGKKFAVDMMKDTLKGDGNPMSKITEVLSENEKIGNKISNSETKARWDKRMQKLTEKHESKPQASKIIMCVFYIILLIAAILLFFWPDVTIYAVHIILGALLVFDGISGIWAVISAKRSGIPMKGQWLSALLNILSIAVGAFFILFSGDTADFTMILCGIVLVLKALSDLAIMIHNRELVSTVKSTFNEIKHQDNSQIQNGDEENNSDAEQETPDTEQSESSDVEKNPDTVGA